MLGSNNYLGLTGDQRVKDAARAGARALRHRADRLALHERHHSTCTWSSSASWPTGWAPRTRSSTPPATSPTPAPSARCSTPATPSSATPATTPRSSTRCRSRAPGCGPSATTASTSSRRCSRAPSPTAAACSWSWTACSRWRATSPPLPDVAALCREHGARLMVDEAHGVGVLGARGARGRGAARLRGRDRPAHGHLLQVACLVRRLHRRAARGDRLPARPVALVHVHGRRGAGGRGRGAGRAARSSAPPRDPS